MRPEYLTRHLDIIDPKVAASKQIHVIGAGAIGSFTVLSLAKMGFSNITVYDTDVVDPENMNCQFYPIEAIESRKLDALKTLISSYTGVNINTIPLRVGKDDADYSDIITGDFLVVAVDNMKAREYVYRNAWATEYLIDPRMAAEYCTMEVVRQGSDRTSYEGTLFSDSDAVQERCTAKSTVYTSTMIAGQVVKAIKDITMNNNYMRTLEWDIANNRLLAWDSEGNKL